MNAIRNSFLTLAASLTLGCCRKRGKEEVIHIPDTEHSVRVLHGEDGHPVKKWISAIETAAEAISWSEVQKLEFALSSLTGPAKEHVDSQENVKTWEDLKMILLRKFDTENHKAVVLESRRKMEDESLGKYVEEMQKIEGQANLKPETICQYIINGLDDAPVDKQLLREATTFSKFKEKMKLYKEAKINAETKRQNTSKEDAPLLNNAEGSTLATWSSIIKPNLEENDTNCYYCDGFGHNERNCRKKQRDEERNSRALVHSNKTCYYCDGFGHIERNCRKKQRDDNETTIIQVRVPSNLMPCNLPRNLQFRMIS